MIVRDSADIGNLIRDSREKLKLTQKELAERAGIHQPKVSQIENGKATAQIGIVLRILAALNLNINIGDLQSKNIVPAIIIDEPDYDEDIDLDAIADTGLKK